MLTLLSALLMCAELVSKLIEIWLLLTLTPAELVLIRAETIEKLLLMDEFCTTLVLALVLMLLVLLLMDEF